MWIYYYYVYESSNGTGNAVTWSDNGGFEILEMTNFLRNLWSDNCIITFWSEISSSQYEKMSKYFENQSK